MTAWASCSQPCTRRPARPGGESVRETAHPVDGRRTQDGLPMSENFFRYEHDGLVFDVAEWGPSDGEAVVLLHGFPEAASSWSHMAPDIAAAGYRVLAPDQRGYSPG